MIRPSSAATVIEMLIQSEESFWSSIFLIDLLVQCVCLNHCVSVYMTIAYWALNLYVFDRVKCWNNESHCEMNFNWSVLTISSLFSRSKSLD